MSRYLRIKRFFRTIPHRILGSHVSEGEHFTRLSTKAHFMTDELLELRIRAARDLIGDDVHIKPDRKLIEENPDGFKRPINYDEWL